MRINDIEYIEVEVLDVRAATHASEAFSMILVNKFQKSQYVPIIIGLNEARAILGEKHGIRYRLVSGDYLKWRPEKIV